MASQSVAGLSARQTRRIVGLFDDGGGGPHTRPSPPTTLGSLQSRSTYRPRATRSSRAGLTDGSSTACASPRRTGTLVTEQQRNAGNAGTGYIGRPRRASRAGRCRRCQRVVGAPARVARLLQEHLRLLRLEGGPGTPNNALYFVTTANTALACGGVMFDDIETPERVRRPGFRFLLTWCWIPSPLYRLCLLFLQEGHWNNPWVGAEDLGVRHRTAEACSRSRTMIWNLLRARSGAHFTQDEESSGIIDAH